MLKAGGHGPDWRRRKLIRLKPPAATTAPIFYAQLDGALVDPQGTADTARIAQKTPLPAPVTVPIQTALAGEALYVPAGVTLTATEIDGVLGLSTRFVRTVQVDETGLASVELLPGHYRVNAVPRGGCTADSCLSATQLEWIVPNSPSQAGKVIEFAPASQVVGRAVVATGDPAVGASVRAVASTSVVGSGVLDLGDGTAPILPRASGGAVDQDGQFSFEADPGIFDFSVVPNPRNGYGWFVHPRLPVPTDSEWLSSIVLDLPIVYGGAVTLNTQDASTPLPGSLIRAYVLLKADGTLTTQAVAGGSAVQVAETQADDAGGFVLLVPPRLDAN